MGERGPVGKRDEERVRRNKPDTPTETIVVFGRVEVPELGIEDPHPLTTDLYNSLKDSAQAKFYEPSDWSVARASLIFADELFKFPNKRGAAMMLTTLNQMWSSLLMTEGDRRRARVEVDRKPLGPADSKVLDITDVLRQRLESTGG
ncbi:hypothetical protein MycrhDRAFT_5728 [Mycolicibacterium rhodesiae JS60]|nr:hypothetical protein MycrhDRAFT_5728 [Mycolicibacterium rhodesiae JS60]